MNVLYFGDPLGAIALLDRGVSLCGLVHGRPGGVGRKALIPRVRELPRWSLPDLEDTKVLSALAALKPTLIVACFYPRRIPEPVLALAPGINVHPSALPRWRGPDPCYWTIHEGDPTTEICVQWLAAELDAGDVLQRTELPVEAYENAGHLATRLEALSAQHIADVAIRLLAGEEIEGQVQQGPVTWAPLVDPNDVEIDWTQPADVVDRLIRAAAPDPGAFTGIGDELLVIHSGRPVDAGRFNTLPAGTPYVHHEVTHIRCGTGAYRIGWLTLGRRRMTGRALARVLI